VSVPPTGAGDPSGPPSPAWIGRRLPATSLLISALCLLVLGLRVDWPSVLGALPRANGGLLAMAAGLALANLGLRSWRWGLLLGAQAPPWRTVVATYGIGVAAGLLVPATGEVARALLLGQRSGLRTSYLLGVAAVEKILDAVAVVLLAVVGLAAAARLDWGLPAVVRGVAVLLALTTALALLLLAPPHRALAPPRWLPAAVARPYARLGLALAEAWERFAAGARGVARLPRRTRLGVLALTLLGWTNACLVTVLTLAAFGLPASLVLAAVLYGALLLGLSVPSAPGAVGTFELITVAVLDAFGLDATASAAFALGFHAVTFGPPIIAGALLWMAASRPAAPPPRPDGAPR
jgi:glycosyltransferase 2 family protein